MQDKRGVSPLIATFLLIAFAVGLGVVVMSFGSNYYKPTEPASCVNVRLEPIKIMGRDEICTTQDDVRYMLINKGQELESIQMLLIGDSVMITELARSSQGQVIQGNIKFDPVQYGTLRQLQFIPRIYNPSSGEILFCFDQSITVGTMRQC